MSHDPDYASPMGLGPRGRGRFGTFRAGFGSAGGPARLAVDRWFRLGARIRKPLRFRIINRIGETRERLRTGTAAGLPYSVGSDRTSIDLDDALALDVVDLGSLDVVMVIGAISVAAMIASVIGDRVSDCRAPDAAHDRADRTADNSSGDRAADRAGDQSVFVSSNKLR